MSQIKVKCPLCNHIQEIPDIYAYKAIKCRKCYKKIEAKPYNEPEINKLELNPESVISKIEATEQIPKKSLPEMNIDVVENKEQFICTYCGYIGHPKNKKLDFIEIFLWLFLLPIGVIYTIWRLVTKCNICPGCNKRASMIPTSTPLGRKLVNQLKE